MPPAKNFAMTLESGRALINEEAVTFPLRFPGARTFLSDIPVRSNAQPVQSNPFPFVASFAAAFVEFLDWIAAVAPMAERRGEVDAGWC